jgi:hypothetical protein
VDLGEDVDEFVEGAQSDEEGGGGGQLDGEEDSAESLLAAADAILPHGLTLDAYKTAAGAARPGSKGGQATLAPTHLSRAVVAGGGRLVIPGKPSAPAIGVAKPGPGAPQGLESESDSLSSPTSDAHRGVFHLDGAVLQLKAAGAKDSLSFRIECLRVYLTEALGEEAFVRMYKQIVASRRADSSLDLGRTCRKAVGDSRAGLLPLVFQLIHSTEECYGSA